MNLVPEDIRNKRTGFAFVWMHLISEPFIALYTLLAFILRKDLGATTFQISVFVTLKPVISFFSFYWSSTLTRNREKLLPNLLGAWLLGRLPFLIFPLYTNVWYLIFASAVYQLFYRASTPAIMEILKLNIEKEKRTSLVSFVYVLSFLESIVLGLFVGKLLDLGSNTWMYLLFGSAILSITSVIFQMRIPLLKQLPDANLPKKSNALFQPWKDSFYLMKNHKEFALFQWGFMFGGFGLMLIAPALVIYYAETLSLTHNDLTIARYIWMGLGVVLTTPIWKKALDKFSLISLTSIVLLGFSLFPFTLLFASKTLFFLDLAFVIYGIAQAGSHLMWHLSGTLFARDEETSSKYTGVNVLMVGLRGAIAPIIGGALCSIAPPPIILSIGAFICLVGSYTLLLFKKRLVRAV